MKKENIKDYPGYYVTSCGKIWSYKSNKFLKPQIDKCGYLSVILSKDSKPKRFCIHKLVAMAYLSNPNNLPEVDHIDRNVKHNYISNLRWISSDDNKRNKKYSMKTIKCIETGQIFKSQNEAARKLNISQGHISAVLNSTRNIAGGLHFTYVQEG